MSEPMEVGEGFFTLGDFGSVLHLPFRQVHSQEFLNIDVGKCLRVREARLPSSYVPGVRSQQSAASCVPLAFLSAMEGAYCLQNCLNVNNFRLENTIEDYVLESFKVTRVLEHAKKVGVPQVSSSAQGEITFARVTDHFSGPSSRLTHFEMMDMMREYGPLIAVVDHTNEMMLPYKLPNFIYSAMGDVVSETPSRSVLEIKKHAFILIGWGEVLDSDDSVISRYFICQNNWGKKFGEDGEFRMWMEVEMWIICLKSMELRTPTPSQLGELKLEADRIREIKLEVERIKLQKIKL